MRLQHTARQILILLTWLLSFTSALAGDEDSVRNRKKESVQIVKENPGGFVVNNNTGSRFADLDKYIESQTNFHFQGIQNEFTADFIEQYNNPVDTGIQAWRARAANAVNEVEQTNAMVDYLQPSDIYQLPVGFKKKIGTNSYITIAVSSAVFKPQYAELTIFARVKIPQLTTPIFFGVTGLKLSYQGGIIGDATLVLLGDVAIPINGNNAMLVLKGGFSPQSGQAQSLTYVTMSCKGFEELSLQASLEFPRSLIEPVKPDGNVDTGRVKANLNRFAVKEWNDILVDVTFTKPFQIKGLNGFVFTVNTAVFDFSDFHNSTNIVYPQGYQERYLDAGNPLTWKGVYVKNLSLALPKAFKNKEDSTRLVTFGVNDLIVDNNGISGIFYAENILPISKGNADGWKFSVDSVRIALEASSLRRAGFGGRIGIPVSSSNDADSVNKRKFLGYSASVSVSGDYICRVVLQDSLDFDIWKGQALLLPNSYIQLAGNKSKFNVEAMLHGRMGVTIKALNESTPNPKDSVAVFKGIEFQALKISTTTGISAQYFGYRGEVKLGNFPISFENINIQSLSPTETALNFGVKLNLGDDAAFSGSTSLSIIGKTQQDRGILSWKYDRIKINRIYVDAKLKAFSLNGWLEFFDDPNPSSSRYGKGFEGGLKLKMDALKGFEIQAKALFAKNPSFRYWYVDAKADLGTGIGAPPFRVRGFGGGAYYRMKKNGFGDAFSETGIAYSADSTAGLGIKAALIFDIGTKGATGEASFEMAFNRGGGLRYIGLFGMVKLSADVLPTGADIRQYIGNNLSKLQDFEQSLSPAQEIDLIKMKETDASKAARAQVKGSDPTKPEPGQTNEISAYIGIQYNFETKILHANFDMYVNVANGMLKGSGAGNRAGWAVFHIEPSKWWLHVGTPTDPIGIKLGLGPLSIQTGAYFMIGHNMPAFPPPPSQVVQILASSAGQTYNPQINSNDIAGGRGIAFGANVSVSTGDVGFLFFYANFAAGLGFDVMIKDYGDAHCAGSNERIGINGWYAQGQAYAYLQGELGIKIKILFVRKKIVLIKGAAAALLQAKLPNPTWVGGQLGFQVDILGGLIRGRFNFKFSFGRDCQIEANQETDAAEILIVESLTPEDNADTVNLFVKPKLTLRLKPGEQMEMPREDGSGNDYYKASVDEFKLYKVSDNSLVPTEQIVSTSGLQYSLKPATALEQVTNYKVVAIVSFKKYVNGNWVTYTDNGTPVLEKKEYKFKTGYATQELTADKIKKMYPFYNQRNYYKDEPNKGMITLATPFPDYMNGFNQWKVKVEKLDGSLVGVVNVTDNNQDVFAFTMPAGLQPNTTYNFLLVGEGPTYPTWDPNVPALKFKFSTSQYGTLAAKMNALHITQAVVGRISSDVIDLQADLSNYEGFELYELIGNNYTDNKPMIEAEVDVTGEDYYNQIIQPLLYPNYPGPMVVNSISFPITDPQGLTYGAPPFKAVTPSWYYLNALQSNSFTDQLRTRMPYVHNTNKYFNLHYLELRTKLINQFLPGNGGIIVGGGLPSGLPPFAEAIMTQGFPFMLKGYYKVKFTFVQLDGTRGNSGVFTYENPIE